MIHHPSVDGWNKVQVRALLVLNQLEDSVQVRYAIDADFPADQKHRQYGPPRNMENGQHKTSRIFFGEPAVKCRRNARQQGATVTQHDALRHPGGAPGVHEDGEVVLVHIINISIRLFVGCLREQLLIGVKARARVIEGYELFDGRKLAADLLCALFVSITDDEDRRLAVVHDEDDLVVTEADIEGRDAHAELGGGEVGLEILRAVVRHDRYPIAFGTAEPDQGVRATVD